MAVQAKLTQAVVGVCLLVFVVASTQPASAAPGDLDPSFGTDGTVNVTQGTDVSDLLIQKPLKKYLVAFGDFVSATSHGVMRLNLDGSPDMSFGTNGVVATSFARRIRLLAGGSFLVMGPVTEGSGSTLKRGIGLARFLPDGTPDSTFGVGGVSRTFFNGRNHNPVDVAVHANGRILVADGRYFGDYPQGDFRLVGFTATGQLDTSFGRMGKAIADFGGADRPRAVAVQPDGKIVVVGSTDAAAPRQVQDSGAARFYADGTLDGSFGFGGFVIARLQGSSSIGAVAIQADGRLLLAGADDDGDSAAVVRLTASGLVDTTFGASGIVGMNPTPSDNDWFQRVATTKDNRIVLLIAAGTGPNQDGVVRLEGTTGAFDATFGFGGVVLKTSGAPPQSMIVQGNGNIVTGTFIQAPLAPAPAVQRYLGN